MNENKMIHRNGFDLGHVVTQSTKFGKLLPFLIQEVVPGDSMEFDINCLVRFQPMLAPTMSDIYGKMDLFFVPNRLIWKNWENFITGGEDGKDTSVAPYIEFASDGDGVPAKSLFDYMGICTGFKGNISAFVPRAINLIWNEWYRDQNLQDKRAISLDDGKDTTTDTSICYRNFEKDYYTCAFPYAQKGDPVRLPLGSTAPVLFGSTGTPATVTPLNVLGSDGDFLNRGSTAIHAVYTANTDAGLYTTTSSDSVGTGSKRVYVNSYADLSEATASTVEDIRKAFQIQKFQWLNLKGGSRYVEYIWNYYGVRSSDARVQRPELIASNTFNVQINEVLQTSQTSGETTPTGTMYGHAISAGSSGKITKSFDEHGIVIGLYSIQPKTQYMQMVERQHTRFSRYDYYNPCFAFLGYQAILNKELYGLSANPDDVFGFQGRYDEMRHRQSYSCGDFRTSLKYWTLTREFSEQPLLNDSFITAANSSDRIFADTTDDYLLCDFYNDIFAYRPLPKDSEPGLIDHVYR